MRFSVGLRTRGAVLEIPYKDFFLRSPCTGVELGHAVLSSGGYPVLIVKFSLAEGESTISLSGAEI